MDNNYNQKSNINPIPENNQPSIETPQTNTVMPQNNVNIPQPNNQLPLENVKAPKSNTALIVIMLIFILALAGLVVKMYLDNNKKSDNSGNSTNYTENNNNESDLSNQTTETDATTTETTTNTDNIAVSNDMFQATVNGVQIKFPATKASFEGTGWTWDEKYATKKLDTGYTGSGGRIGTYPGGVVVSVVNTSGEMKEIQDCVIDDGTFYNPKDGSNDVVFIGGLTYSATKDQVKSKMAELNYTNVKESTVDALTNYRYYKDNNESNYKDYIEFSFYNEVLSNVSIFTSGN